MNGNATEELSQQGIGMLTRELEETNGRETVNTAKRGGLGDGYVMNNKKDPGVWGPDGLLAVPHVKLVMFLICVVQVRYEKDAHKLDHHVAMIACQGRHSFEPVVAGRHSCPWRAVWVFVRYRPCGMLADVPRPSRWSFRRSVGGRDRSVPVAPPRRSAVTRRAVL